MFRLHRAFVFALIIACPMIFLGGCSSDSGGGGGGGDGEELPDLTMPDLNTGAATSVEQGQPVSVRYRLRNDYDGGDEERAAEDRGLVTAPAVAASPDAGPFKVTFYFSTDTDYDVAADQAMSPVLEMDGFLADEYMESANWVMDIPPAMTPGDYYVFAIVDSDDEVEERDETNNMGTMFPGFITVFAPAGRLPDLSGFSAAYHADLTVGETTTCTVGFTNRGMVASDTGCMLALYVSEDSVLGAGDVLIDGAAGSLPAMATGEDIYREITFTVPGDILGDAYIIVQVDSEDAVTEESENDNNYTMGVTISQ